jgi:HTH-like domain
LWSLPGETTSERILKTALVELRHFALFRTLWYPRVAQMWPSRERPGFKGSAPLAQLEDRPENLLCLVVEDAINRALWDMTITEILAGYYQPDRNGRRRPESLCGSLKMWAHHIREGIEVARCTVERLMRANGWQGVCTKPGTVHFANKVRGCLKLLPRKNVGFFRR